MNANAMAVWNARHRRHWSRIVAAAHVAHLIDVAGLSDLRSVRPWTREEAELRRLLLRAWSLSHSEVRRITSQLEGCDRERRKAQAKERRRVAAEAEA